MHTTPDTQRDTFSLLGYLKQVMNDIARTIMRVAGREVLGGRFIDAAEWKRNAKLKEQAGEVVEAFCHAVGLVCLADQGEDPTRVISELLSRPCRTIEDFTEAEFERIAALIPERHAA